MKSKLLNLTAAALMLFSIKTQAQAIYSPATYSANVIDDGFEHWTTGSPIQPTNWGGANSTITASHVTQVTNATYSPTLAVQSGNYAVKVTYTNTTYGYLTTDTTYSVTAGTAYAISFYARGKGDIAAGVTDGGSTSSTWAAAPPAVISSKSWYPNYLTVIAPTTTNNAQFFLKIKSTGTYTSSTFPAPGIVGVDIDSVVIRPYTPQPFVNLYSLQYTTASNGNSPFWGQQVAMTGGIVTGINYDATGATAYYIQNTGAGDTLWAAGYVYDYNSAPLVQVGDSVNFGCAVTEYFSMTEFQQIVNFTDVSTATSHTYNIPSHALTTQTYAQEMYESTLINIQGATVNSYTASYGQATITDASGVAGEADLKDGFYPPSGTATSGSSGNPGYQPITGDMYCFIGNVYTNFGYNIEPRCSTDVVLNCTTLTGAELASACLASSAGIQNYNNNLHADVYPNPLNNQLTVKLPLIASQVNISFTDVLGKEVMTMNNLSGSTIAINDISGLASGVYLVKIIADGNTQLVKVIKQ